MPTLRTAKNRDSQSAKEKSFHPKHRSMSGPVLKARRNARRAQKEKYA